MIGTDIAAALIDPTAVGIDGPRRIQRPDNFRQPCGIKLTPGLVEQHPDTDAGKSLQGFDHLRQLPLKILPVRRIPDNQPITLLLIIPRAQVQRHIFAEFHHLFQGCQRFSAADHILPNQNTKPVAEIVPPGRFHLDMFPEHVKSQLLYRAKFLLHSLLGGAGVKAVRPVALIQKTNLKIGFSVQRNQGRPVFPL